MIGFETSTSQERLRLWKKKTIRMGIIILLEN
jgi:hypothetical protein